MSIAQGFLGELEHESAVTREKIKRVPDDKLAYKPHEKSRSFGALIGHIGESTQWGVAILTQDVFDFNPDEYTPPTPDSVDEAVEAFDKGIAALKDSLQNIDDEKMLANWKMVIKG